MFLGNIRNLLFSSSEMRKKKYMTKFEQDRQFSDQNEKKKKGYITKI